MSEHSDPTHPNGGPNVTVVFVYSSKLVDKALDTNTVVIHDALVYVPEILVMEAMGRPGGDPNFDPATAWKVIRQSDNQAVFVWTLP